MLKLKADDGGWRTVENGQTEREILTEMFLGYLISEIECVISYDGDGSYGRVRMSKPKQEWSQGLSNWILVLLFSCMYKVINSSKAKRYAGWLVGKCVQSG